MPPIGPLAFSDQLAQLAQLARNCAKALAAAEALATTKQQLAVG